MKKSEQAKENIISVTTSLIQESNGNLDEITIRKIAQEAGVGIGLINYHFQSKEQLVELCVQRIISSVIHTFRPELLKDLQPIDRLKTVSKLVADFLMDNPEVSRISILGDHANPGIEDNTMKTVSGFLHVLTGSDIAESKQKMLLFTMTSILQAAFLRKEISKECFGVNFYDKTERDFFIDDMIERLLEDS
ncbi:TetR family transcriptional regulator [Lachnospiraceae bacterium MD1]|uniref:TetR family transcriptional regulator n=1 Tax=Variimorphobacter saccharofermentans TaxID=2755051 RepID=A0A839K5S2_9FIRM|nr:TetR/AcrR family transcriptional regulator [Variimorphobacter saccharofermentans]MBB2184409.1 TetR family transcriptional regulator [Variimorphobacter saccharofermentans]